MKYLVFCVLLFVGSNGTIYFQKLTYSERFYRIGDLADFRCPEDEMNSPYYKFSWDLITEIEGERFIENIKHGHRYEASDTTIYIDITSWMSYVKTIVRCEMMDEYRVYIYDYRIVVISEPELISFISGPEFDYVAITCIMKGNPTPDIELIISDLGENNFIAPADIHTTKDNEVVLIYKTTQQEFLKNTFVCRGNNSHGRIQSTLSKTRKIGIFGPENFTYQENDRINLTCIPPEEYKENVTFKWFSDFEHYDYEPYSSQAVFDVTLGNNAIRCKVKASNVNESWISEPFVLNPGKKTEQKRFYLTKYMSQGKLNDKIVCEMSGMPLPELRLFLSNQRPPNPPLENDYDYHNNISRLTWNIPKNETLILKNFTCIGANRFAVKKSKLYKLRPAKGKFDAPCQFNSDCSPKKSVCLNNTCQCLEPLYVARRYNYKEECVPVRFLQEPCEYNTQCAAGDVNSGCIFGFCQCFAPYKMIGNHCWRPVFLGERCYSDLECQAGVANSECKRVSTRYLCACKNRYWQKKNLCVYHGYFLDGNYLHTVSILGLAGIALLFVILVALLIVSARVLQSRRRQQNREAFLKNQNLSRVSDRVPMKNPPPPEIKKAPLNEPHTPVELRVPEVKDRSDSVVLSAEPTICIPETIPFIKDNDNSIC